jgi:hypothetical protein
MKYHDNREHSLIASLFLSIILGIVFLAVIVVAENFSGYSEVKIVKEKSYEER